MKSRWSAITSQFPDETFLSSIEELIRELLPPPPKEKPWPEFYQNIEKSLPIIHYSLPSASTTLTLTTLSHGDFGHGTGRFISDLCSRWLIPGKQIPIIMARSSSFTFINYDRTQFFISQLVFHTDQERDDDSVKYHIERLIQEIRLSILAAEQARKIVSMKSLTLKQKEIVLEENLFALLGHKIRRSHTIFDEAHHLIVKASSEEKMEELYKELASLFTVHPQTLNRDLFEEIHPFLSLLSDAFKATRESQHLIRITAYQHLFKKILKHTHNQISLKLMRSVLNHEGLRQPVLGILVGINLCNDHDFLEERQLFKAIQAIIPYALKVSESYLTDRRCDPKLRLMYLEIKKQGRLAFTQTEISDLRKRLSTEIKSRIETAVHPLYMEQSDDDIMKTIFVLSKAIKKAGEPPHAVIHFYKQTNESLSFIIILLRLITDQEKSLKGLIEISPLASDMDIVSTKIVGTSGKKHLKEASVFKLRLNKNPFLKENGSIDLRKARLGVLSTLHHFLGEVRDFNGGMVSVQQELLSEFKGLLKGKSRQSNFLIENFFYSLTPVYMQSLLAPPLLKAFFLLLLQALEHNFTAEPFFSKTHLFGHTFMIMLGSPHTLLIETIYARIQKHPFLSRQTTSSKISSYDIHILGYLLNFEEQSDYLELRKAILDAIVSWQEAHQETHPLLSDS